MPTQVPSIREQIDAKRVELLAVRRTITEARLEAMRVQQDKIRDEQRVLDDMRSAMNADIRAAEDALMAEIRSMEQVILNTQGS